MENNENAAFKINGFCFVYAIWQKYCWVLGMINVIL